MQTFATPDVTQSGTETVADLLSENVPNAILSDTEANPFQEDLYFRGYDASPVLGTAVGLAVYQGETRVNERFGDTVLWDLIPSFAVARIDVVTGSNPVFGLNALGGAVVLDMKDGFGAPGGARIDVSSGSFGRTRATVEFASDDDGQSVYAGLNAVHDGGWRRHSQSDLVQAYGAYGVRSGATGAGVDLTLATDFLNENAAVPVQDDPRAAFSIPDTAQDSVVFLTGHVENAMNDALTARVEAHFRWTDIRTVNGEAFPFASCTTDSSLLCTDDDPDDPLVDTSGTTIPASSGADGTDGITDTATAATGAVAELDWNGRILGLADRASFGVEGDYAHTAFRSTTVLATVTVDDGGVTGHSLGILLGTPQFNVGLAADNADESLFLENTLTLGKQLSLLASIRANFDTIRLTDLEGSSLTGTHGYSSVNPALTATWAFSDSTSAYLSAGQSNRIPTAAELSCANPASPCLFPLSFISDPGLKQVFARSVEGGARGTARLGGLGIDWHWDAFWSRNENDILFVSAGPTIGSGFFTNVGAIERVGSEASLKVSYGAFDASANAGFVEATFRSAFAEQSTFNPGAEGNGLIFVKPGDRLPNVPRFIGEIAAGYQMTPDLHVQVSANLQSARFLRGDEANLESPLPGFVVFGLEAAYRIDDRLSAQLAAENVFDKHYATFGLFGDPTANGSLPQFTNPRFIVPAQPFGIWAGLSLRM